MRREFDKYLNSGIKALNDPEATDEIRLCIILDLLYHCDITLRRAGELCKKYGLYKNHWAITNSMAASIWEKYYDKEKY